jgi:hypothetical protein
LIGFWALAASGIASTKASSIPNTRSIMGSLFGYESFRVTDRPASSPRDGFYLALKSKTARPCNLAV